MSYSQYERFREPIAGLEEMYICSKKKYQYVDIMDIASVSPAVLAPLDYLIADMALHNPPLRLLSSEERAQFVIARVSNSYSPYMFNHFWTNECALFFPWDENPDSDACTLYFGDRQRERVLLIKDYLGNGLLAPDASGKLAVDWQVAKELRRQAERGTRDDLLFLKADDAKGCIDTRELDQHPLTRWLFGRHARDMGRALRSLLKETLRYDLHRESPYRGYYLHNGVHCYTEGSLQPITYYRSEILAEKPSWAYNDTFFCAVPMLPREKREAMRGEICVVEDPEAGALSIADDGSGNVSLSEKGDA